MVSASVKSLYTVVLCQAHAQEHGVMVAGDNFGNLLAYDVSGLLQQDRVTSPTKTDRLTGPVVVIKAHTNSVYSLVHTPMGPVTGTIGSMSLWNWNDIRKSTPESLPKATSVIQIESDQSNLEAPEVNHLSYDANKKLLWAACGDWKTRAYSLETGKLVLSLDGHKDYVHQVASHHDNSVVTCGEDGQVLIWDSRTPREPRSKIVPHEIPSLARPSLGKYIKSVDYSGGEWVVCGGGPRSALFHLRSGGLVTALPPADPLHGITVTSFAGSDDSSSIITSGGDEGAVSVCDISGRVNSLLTASARCVYSVCVSKDKSTLMTIAGRGNKIDLCLNMSYKDHSLSTAYNRR